MNLPFTTEQFLAVFEQYNQTVWPIQIFLNLVALCALILAVRRTTQSDKIISAILAFLWLWIGIVYHLVFFAPINPAARVFAGLNILQGLMFVYFGLFRPRLSFQFKPNFYGITGSILILYALIIYPVLGLFLGHQYPKSPTFGLPCPTTIFTLGLLLWTSARIPKAILIIPFIWSLIGFSAALTMGIHEDIGLLVAGIAVTTMVIIRDRKSPDVEAGAARVA
jgi:hypothetical protein